MGIGVIAVDGGNIVHQQSNLPMERRPRVNYVRLIERLEARLNVTLPFRMYYDAFKDQGSLDRRSLFYGTLRNAGWTLFSFQSKFCSDGVWRDKGLDITLALDVYRLALLKQVTTAIIMSHDGDFVSLAKAVKKAPYGVRAVVVGWDGRISRDLEQAVDEVVTIESLGRDVVRAWQKEDEGTIAQ
jgi:uncharacterized LabA/DUF88 family protein